MGWGAAGNPPRCDRGRRSHGGRSNKEDGVRCYAPGGEPIGKIHLPETFANLCFGGKKKNRRFVAGSTSVYAVYVETVGALVS
jgi:gluconolactonase